MPIERLRPSFSFDEERIKKLKTIVPEAFADGKINWESLKDALGKYLEDESGEVEHFGLFWPGKKEARRIASKPSKGTLVPVYGEGLKTDGTPDDDGVNDSHNIFIEGENLEILKILQKSYAGRIKMIYIDPPYNTGNDFVYDDDFTEPLDEYLRRTGQIDGEGKPLTTNKRADGRFHSKWLNMMYPRLKLARNLLRDDGVIFVSIDDNELSNLLLIMNEIFGDENFLATYIWKRRASSALADKNVSADHEYVISFHKNSFEVFKGIGKNFDTFKNPDNDPRGDYVLGDLTVGMTASMRPNQAYDLINPKTGIAYPFNPNRVWAFIPSSMKKLIEDGKIYFPEDSSKRPMMKRYKKDLLGNTNPISTLLTQVGLNTEATKSIQDIFNSKVFEYSKPLSLLTTLISQVTNKDKDIILDFFAGSGTTSHSVLNLNKEDGGNRRFILVQMPELCDEKSEAFKAGYKNIAEIGKERIRRVVKRIKENTLSDKLTDQDLGFKSFNLCSSNFKEWKNAIENNSNELQSLFEKHISLLIEGSKAESLISEIILLEGFPLDSRITRLSEFKSNEVRLISSELNDHKLIVCFDEKIKEDTINKLDLGEKDIFVCFDTAISDKDKLRLSDKGLIKTI